MNCMNEKVMVEDEIRSDIHVSIDAWVGDMMHPEREIQNIQKNNPLTEERKEQILAMDGVENLEVGWYAGSLSSERRRIKRRRRFGSLYGYFRAE